MIFTMYSFNCLTENIFSLADNFSFWMEELRFLEVGKENGKMMAMTTTTIQYIKHNVVILDATLDGVGEVSKLKTIPGTELARQDSKQYK